MAFPSSSRSSEVSEFLVLGLLSVMIMTEPSRSSQICFGSIDVSPSVRQSTVQMICRMTGGVLLVGMTKQCVRVTDRPRAACHEWTPCVCRYMKKTREA